MKSHRKVLTLHLPGFGTWERIFYGEWDGRRDKRVLIKILGE